ncbi:site-specific integrase [Mycobacteroides abscessus]|uniref:Site-specific integrase n=1 Tax=Mycobacteroides abscessus TaxID=36809 RepID=A0ABD7HH27_9MYCO|nr:site-specific integrase [Mycobacteroides abscessus]RIR40378.1 site-specific integrase [Mycobacteroides abscessus]RIS61993.1 site-specific integrase [Mycobacteroides abscessus]RIT29278.1 site-specific integrase [Mycobacteroides abscessus]
MSGRRTSGEGTVYRRKDGRWEAAAYLPTATGTRRRISVYGGTRGEAQRKLTTRLADAERGIPVPERSWTIAGYLDYWFGEVAPLRLRPKTLELYESVIRTHLKPLLGHQSLTRLSVPVLQQVLNRYLATGHSIRTVRVTRTVLSAALTRAMREELVTRNVARLVELPSEQPKEVIPWTAQEGARFLSVAKSDPRFPAYLLLMLFGLRRGELLGLRWSDVDWDNGQIHIRQQLLQIGGELQVGPVKTRAGQRDLPLIPLARKVLAQHQARTAAAAHNTWDLVITGDDGRPLWPRNFARMFHRLRERAGLRRIRIHDLRHMTATMLKDLGVPARDAQLILGHAHISTTQQIYQHGDAAAQHQAIDRIGQVLQALPTQTSTAESSRRSRQNQPSMAETVVLNASIISGGSSGARTHDTLLKRRTLIGERDSFTSVITQLRTRTNTHILGYIAVKSSRQDDQ